MGLEALNFSSGIRREEGLCGRDSGGDPYLLSRFHDYAIVRDGVDMVEIDEEAFMATKEALIAALRLEVVESTVEFDIAVQFGMDGDDARVAFGENYAAEGNPVRSLFFLNVDEGSFLPRQSDDRLVHRGADGVGGKRLQEVLQGAHAEAVYGVVAGVRREYDAAARVLGANLPRYGHSVGLAHVDVQEEDVKAGSLGDGEQKLFPAGVGEYFVFNPLGEAVVGDKPAQRQELGGYVIAQSDSQQDGQTPRRYNPTYIPYFGQRVYPVGARGLAR